MPNFYQIVDFIFRYIKFFFSRWTDICELMCNTFFEVSRALPSLSSHWKCKWRSSVTIKDKTTFQLNSGTKSDKEKSEGNDEGPSRVCSWGLPAESPKPRRSEPCRGIKALRAAITLTTRREVPRTGSIFRDFFHGMAIGDDRKQNLVFIQTTKTYNVFKKHS